MSNTPVITGDTIRNLREHLGLTQAEAAERWEVSRKTVFNWEAYGEEPLPGRAQTRARHALEKPQPSQDRDDIDERDVEQFAKRLFQSNQALRGAVDEHGLRPVVKEMIAMHGQLEHAASFIEAAARLHVDPASIRLAARTLADLYIDSGVLRILMAQDSQRALEPLSRLSAMAVFRQDSPSDRWIFSPLSEADVTLAASDADIDAEVEAQQEEP